MADQTGHRADRDSKTLRPERWGTLLLLAGFAAGAAVGLGLPAFVAYQLRADPAEVPTEWRTESGPAAGSSKDGRQP